MDRDVVAGIIEGEELAAEVALSAAEFDLNSPLTETELAQLADQFDVSTTPSARAPRELEDELYTYRDKPSPEAVATDPAEYGAEYRAYLRWQAIAAVAADDETWLAIQELVLVPFVRQCKLEDEGYDGYDQAQAFSLRLRHRVAKEFARHVIATFTSAAEVARPSLIGK